MKASESQKSTVSEGTTAPEGETNGATAVVSFAPFRGIRDLENGGERISLGTNLPIHTPRIFIYEIINKMEPLLKLTLKLLAHFGWNESTPSSVLGSMEATYSSGVIEQPNTDTILK